MVAYIYIAKLFFKFKNMTTIDMKKISVYDFLEIAN
jgi:hypothetical protein